MIVSRDQIDDSPSVHHGQNKSDKNVLKHIQQHLYYAMNFYLIEHPSAKS